MGNVPTVHYSIGVHKLSHPAAPYKITASCRFSPMWRSQVKRKPEMHPHKSTLPGLRAYCTEAHITMSDTSHLLCLPETFREITFASDEMSLQRTQQQDRPLNSSHVVWHTNSSNWEQGSCKCVPCTLGWRGRQNALVRTTEVHANIGLQEAQLTMLPPKYIFRIDEQV